MHRRQAVNYTAGATVFAAFATLDSPSTFEVFLAVGRPGEPLTAESEATPSTGGVSVDRYTTTNFVEYSEPTTVLFLPNDTPPPGSATNDQGIWTVKSMDRDDQGDPDSATPCPGLRALSSSHPHPCNPDPACTQAPIFWLPSTPTLPPFFAPRTAAPPTPSRRPESFPGDGLATWAQPPFYPVRRFNFR